jgi:hypothetical protein
VRTARLRWYGQVIRKEEEPVEGDLWNEISEEDV